MHASRMVLVALFAFSDCSRITATSPAPDNCTPQDCGEFVSVQTGLDAGTALTRAECEDVCAGVWCGRESFVHQQPGCTLTTQTQVFCDATMSDCGHCWFPCTTASECADGGGTCTNGCCAN